MITTKIILYSPNTTPPAGQNYKSDWIFATKLVRHYHIYTNANYWLSPNANGKVSDFIGFLYTLWSYSNIKLQSLLGNFRYICRFINWFIGYNDPVVAFNFHLITGYLHARVWSLLKRYFLTLDLAFDSIPLRSICENEEVAIGELGLSAAEILKHRLSDLRAATSVNDLIVGHPHEVESGVDNYCMVIDLCNNYQIIFCANHTRNPVGRNGKVDWQKVSRVKILRIKRSLC